MACLEYGLHGGIFLSPPNSPLIFQIEAYHGKNIRNNNDCLMYSIMINSQGKY